MVVQHYWADVGQVVEDTIDSFKTWADLLQHTLVILGPRVHPFVGGESEAESTAAEIEVRIEFVHPIGEDIEPRRFQSVAGAQGGVGSIGNQFVVVLRRLKVHADVSKSADPKGGLRPKPSGVLGVDCERPKLV
ncbi:hypothetical protein H4Q26_005724 [Puccinia striiformis f. sp. tritici PST-130]|nr:hypothetical protein H4Q26_005724 [Puccinia striiformis f. sp. tritici PST-130]